jgi:hypothetical protein
VRTGGVEPPQHEATGLQPAELADAQRPQERGGRPGSNRRQRGSQPRVLPSTPRPPRNSGDDRTRTGGLSPDKRVLLPSELRPRRGGRRDLLPATGGRDVAVCSAPEPAVAHRRSCQRVSAPPPPHRLALEACRSQLHVRTRALHQPLFRHFLGPPVGGPILSSAGGIRTHGLELMRLARTAAPLPRKSGWQESNLRSPAPEAGGVSVSPTAS